MNILHHVKKHGKTITLHLKKHHKKYIFGILSATLLWKGISLIAAYALVHNLSFSFADNGGNEGTTTENLIEITRDIVAETTTGETISEQDNELDSNEQTTQDEEAIQIDKDNTNGENINTVDNNNNDETNTFNDMTEIENNSTNNEGITSEVTNQNSEINNNNDEENENNNNNDKTDNEDSRVLEGSGNGICDNGDINILKPVNGDKVGKTFDISWEFVNDDCKDNTYTIRLRNFNDKYLDIFTGNYDMTGFAFNSIELLNDNSETGTNYFTGHKLAIVSNDAEIIYWNQEGGEFTIDNKIPEISNIAVEYSTNNEKLNIGDTITITFRSDEELKSSTVNVLGQYALLEEKSGNNYKFSMDFSEKNTLGKIVYGIEFEDVIGNTGYYEGYEDRELDYTKPTISDLGFSKIGEGKIKITFNTNKATDANLIYQISGTEMTISVYNTGTDQHRITLNNIGKSYKYNYSISIEDEAKNIVYIGGNFYLSGDNVVFTGKEINQSESLIDFGFKGNKENPKIFTNNFNSCAENIDTKDLKLVINKRKTTTVKVPEFSSSKVNTLTNAFIAVLFERIENERLSQESIDEITEDLNNFLIIIKLVKDDENECKQNMSEYYINKFKHTLKKHGIIE